MPAATIAEGTPSSAAMLISLRPSRLNISWARAAGTKAVSSRSMPRNWPFGAITPITRKCRPPMRRRWPSGFSPPNSSFLTFEPEDDEGARAAAPRRRAETGRCASVDLEHLRQVGVDAIDRASAACGRCPRPRRCRARWGVTATTCGRRSSERASSSDSGRALDGRPDGCAAGPASCPDARSTTLVPNWVNSAEHEAVDALADRGQQDHRGDADGDAEQRQETAQPLRGDGAQRELEGVGEDHG